MDVFPLLMANSQSAKLVEPSKTPLHTQRAPRARQQKGRPIQTPMS